MNGLFLQVANTRDFSISIFFLSWSDRGDPAQHLGLFYSARKRGGIEHHKGHEKASSRISNPISKINSHGEKMVDRGCDPSDARFIRGYGVVY